MSNVYEPRNFNRLEFITWGDEDVNAEPNASGEAASNIAPTYSTLYQNRHPTSEAIEGFNDFSAIGDDVLNSSMQVKEQDMKTSMLSMKDNAEGFDR